MRRLPRRLAAFALAAALPTATFGCASSSPQAPATAPSPASSSSSSSQNVTEADDNAPTPAAPTAATADLAMASADEAEAPRTPMAEKAKASPEGREADKRATRELKMDVKMDSIGTLGAAGVGAGGGGLAVGGTSSGVGRRGPLAQAAPSRPAPPPPPPPEPKPAEDPVSPGGTFVHAGTNPFIETTRDRLSTFAVDVDTGSFSYARRFLKGGNLPPDASVRVEEWVNAMHYGYEGPSSSSKVPFQVHVSGAPSPIARGKHLVRVALQGKKVSKQERGPTHLVFLVDVSGSMGAHDKLPLAQEALHMMVDELRDDDSVALVTYAGRDALVLPTTTIKHKKKVHDAINALSSGGGTNMGSGMEMAYREAQKHLGGGRSARVVVLSDGDANIGRTSHQAILQSVKGYVSEGAMLSTVGFGTGNYNDHLMEQLADAGNGNYTYIDSKKTAERFFVQELDGTLETIAQDVKIQVEWNPEVVSHYRLVGYENRDVADKDFRNDKKDAGEIGAGHAVTALYELQLTSSTPTESLGTVRVRAKKPRHTRAEEIEVAIAPGVLQDRPNDLDDDAVTAAAVALAAEILRRSPYAEGRTLSEAAALLREAANGPHAAERLELARDLARVEPRLATR